MDGERSNIAGLYVFIPSPVIYVKRGKRSKGNNINILRNGHYIMQFQGFDWSLRCWSHYTMPGR